MTPIAFPGFSGGRPTCAIARVSERMGEGGRAEEGREAQGAGLFTPASRYFSPSGKSTVNPCEKFLQGVAMAIFKSGAIKTYLQVHAPYRTLKTATRLSPSVPNNVSRTVFVRVAGPERLPLRALVALLPPIVPPPFLVVPCGTRRICSFMLTATCVLIAVEY